MTGQLPAKEKKKRYGRAMALQQKVSCEVQRGFIGKTLRVLIEKRANGGFVARSHADAPEIDGSVQVRGAARVGEFARVRDYRGERVRSYRRDITRCQRWRLTETRETG